MILLVLRRCSLFCRGSRAWRRQIGPAYLTCKTSRVNGTAWDECSDTADPSWNGYPGCHLTNNPWGWQICTAFGYGQNMRFLQNSSKGLQWSEKWQQHYFKIPPYVGARLRIRFSSSAPFVGSGRCWLRSTPAPRSSQACRASRVRQTPSLYLLILVGVLLTLMAWPPDPHGVNQTVTIWQDDARSLAPKYKWAVEAW